MSAAPSQAAAPAPLAPVTAEQRIGLLDALRAVALLGIFLVNIEWFTRAWQTFDRGVVPGLSGLDLAAAWSVHVFVAGKFWILFSLLFGMGFALMVERAQAAGGSNAALLRRLAVLLALGLAHALLQWVGDILHTYAIAGLLLLAFRRAQAKTQLAVGLSIYLGLCALSLLSAVAMYFAPADMIGEMRAVAADDTRAGELAAAVYAGGGFAEVTAQRVHDFFTVVATNVFIIPMALAVFLIGSWLLRSGRIRDPGAHRRFFVQLAAACLPIGLGLTLWGASIGVSHPDGMIDGPSLLAASLHALGALPLALGYLALLVLAWQSASGARALAALAPAGRMALTNYLLQSLLGSLVFYGYGLAMWGRIGHAGLLLLVLVVFALQVLASRWWLARFRFGPVEWAWRWLTYGTRPPMRQAGAGGA